MKKALLAVSLILALCLLEGGTSKAATTGTSFNVVATVGPICSVFATDINFGSYQGSQILSNGYVNVTCPPGTPYSIAIDAGQNYDSSTRARKISNRVDNLFYAILKDTSFTAGSEWGDSDYSSTYPDGSSLADTGNGAEQPHVMYGVLLDSAAGNPAVASPGTYTDVVQVTVYY
jgi:spore coat protein U-like protein